MHKTKRTPTIRPHQLRTEHFLEEGTAFLALEGAQLRTHVPDVGNPHSEREAAMNDTVQEAADQQHVVPVEAWDAIADAYDKFVAPAEADLATEVLRLAGLEPGHRFLDVAAGTGGLSLPAARLGAKVVATDWSPRMLERFEARVRQQGLHDAEARVMDCHALDFPDGAFDVTGSQFGVMLVPDQPKALREMVRVTRRGGRILVIAYGSPKQFEAVNLFIAALQAVVPAFPGLPDDPPPLEFQVSDPKVMEHRLIEAGLREVTVNTSKRERVEVRSGKQVWDWCLGSNPITSMLTADLTAAQKTSVVDQLDQIIAARVDEKGIAVLTAPLNIGIGTK